MKIEKLNSALDIFKRDLGDSLLATDIFSVKDGASLVGYNSNPKACALFNEVTLNLISSLKGSGFPGLNDYYLINLKDGKMVVVMYFLDYQWGCLLDSNKVKLGLLINIIIPNAKAAFLKSL